MSRLPLPALRQPTAFLAGAFLASACLASACATKDGGGLMCTDLAAASVAVTVSTSDGSTPSDVAATYTSEDSDTPTPCDDFGDGTWICGYEVEGTVDVVVTATGYQDFEGRVDVASDGCHVIEEEMDALLVPTAGS